MFGAWGFLVEDGGMMSLVSPLSRRKAAELTNALISGGTIPRDMGHIPIVKCCLHAASAHGAVGLVSPNLYTSYARATAISIVDRLLLREIQD